MQRRIRRTALAVLLAVTGPLGLAACDGDKPAPAVTATVTAPAPTVTVTAAPTPAASDPAPSASATIAPSASASATVAPSASATVAPTPPAQGARKPDVVLTGDPEAAEKELDRLKRTGWWNPDEIEYADDPVTALQQFDRWLGKGFVAPGGGWTAAGRAAVDAANEGGPEL